MKVLHVLDHSLPYFSGYSFRSDYIVRAQKRLGLCPIVVTSPKHEDFSSERETIDEIDFYRVRWPSASSSSRLQAIPFVRQMACVAALSKQIVRLAGELKVEIVHAHSPSLNGLAVARAVETLGLPWVYEVRYYDEDAAVDRGKIRHNSLRYKMSRKLEQSALEQATRVATISSALRDDLIARGVDEGKIFEAPNGVDVNFFQPLDPDERLTAKYDLSGKIVVGFIGSFYFYEGLEHLVDAVLTLIERGRDVKLALVGEGEAEESLRARIPDRRRDHFIFAGKIPHQDVRRYYSVMDIMVYPRVKSRLTELTTPLKPLEAMAMEKAVVGSDIGGMRELIRNGETGFLVEPENAGAIAECLAKLAKDKALRRDLGRRARETAARDRMWERIVERYLDVYTSMLH